MDSAHTQVPRTHGIVGPGKEGSTIQMLQVAFPWPPLACPKTLGAFDIYTMHMLQYIALLQMNSAAMLWTFGPEL